MLVRGFACEDLQTKSGSPRSSTRRSPLCLDTGMCCGPWPLQVAWNWVNACKLFRLMLTAWDVGHDGSGFCDEVLDKASLLLHPPSSQ